jgi:uncharacterized protein YbaR (Trm112 family)
MGAFARSTHERAFGPQGTTAMTDPANPVASDAPPVKPASVDPRLLEILVCPVTKKPLVYDREAGELISKAAGLAYPIRDGIPIMLPDEARKLTD